MNKKIAFFDLDGTLWNIHSDIWVIDKEKPFKPVLKIPSLEFSLIKNGIYQKDNLPLDYNGQKFYISKELFNKISKRRKSENLNRFGISFNNFYDKKILNKSKVDYLLDNIEHLRGKKDVKIGLLTARANKPTHSDVVNDLRLKLKDMGISIDKIYFTGDKFKVYHDQEGSLKKVYILLEHLIGFKIKNDKFVSLRQDWYPEVHFYDDYKGNIDYANDVQKILNDLVKNTEDDLLSIINERINTNNIKLYNYLITNNDVNRFEITEVKIEEPDKFPIFEKKIETYNDFQVNEFKNPFLRGNERKIIERFYGILKDKLDSGEMDYECIKDIKKITGDAAMYPSWGGDGNYTDSITIVIYKDGKRIEVKDTLSYRGYVISISYEDDEDEELGGDWDDNDGVKRIEIKNHSYKFERLIKKLCNNKKKYDKENIKNNRKNDEEDFLNLFDEEIDESWTGGYVYKSEKDIKKEMNNTIKDILNSFTMEYIFDYRITNYIVDFFDKNTKIEVTIFGYGSALGDGNNSQDALLKLVFQKKKKIWQVSYRKSKAFRKMQNRTTEYKLENLIKIRTEILNYLNKK